MTDQQKPRSWIPVSGLDRRTLLKASAGATAMVMVQSAFVRDALAQDRPLTVGLQFFSPLQAETVSAIAERVWPATEESPGARDAGVVYYIDRALAGDYEQYQLDYRVGLQALDTLAVEQHNAPFRLLTADQQQSLLERIEADGDQEAIQRAEQQQGLEGPAPSVDQTMRGQEAMAPAAPRPQLGMFDRQIAGLTPPRDASLPAFFDLVYAHTMEGLFSDPIYGGNRGFAGWRAVGYPGAHYVYTEEEQQSFEPLDKPFQSIADI